MLDGMVTDVFSAFASFAFEIPWKPTLDAEVRKLYALALTVSV